MNNRRRRIAKARRLINRLHSQDISAKNLSKRQHVIARLRALVGHVATVR